VDVVMLVTEVTDGPIKGGLMSTKILRIPPDEFEKNCGEKIKHYRAFYADYPSECLKSNKSKAAFYSELGKSVFLVTKEVER
jgi:hypothetical protein